MKKRMVGQQQRRRPPLSNCFPNYCHKPSRLSLATGHHRRRPELPATASRHAGHAPLAMDKRCSSRRLARRQLRSWCRRSRFSNRSVGAPIRAPSACMEAASRARSDASRGCPGFSCGTVATVWRSEREEGPPVVLVATRFSGGEAGEGGVVGGDGG